MQWSPEWERHSGAPIPVELIRVIVDCFHLPFGPGEGGRRLLELGRRTLTGDAAARRELHHWELRLAALFHDLAPLKNRDLLEAFWSPVWQLKDELALIRQLGEEPGPGPHDLPDFPRDIARGGLLHSLRALTRQHPDGRFSIEHDP